MHTILGAGGVIANGLVSILTESGLPVKRVSRNPGILPGTISFPADITNREQAFLAIRDSSVVYLAIGLPYNYTVWRQQWPRIMDNVIAACRESGASLVFCDNVYMYGKVEGRMTEETAYNPCSRKGDLRARLATTLMGAVRREEIQAMIVRAADFYGPDAEKTGVANLMVFENLAKNKKPLWLANAMAKHSFTYTPDAVRAIHLLANTPDAWNQVWHLPTAGHPLTGSEFISLAAKAMGKGSAYRVMSPLLVRLAGLFNRTVAELHEMLYQYRYDYLFDSSKFEKAFDFRPTPYSEGIAATAAAYLRKHP